MSKFYDRYIKLPIAVTAVVVCYSALAFAIDIPRIDDTIEVQVNAATADDPMSFTPAIKPEI